MQIPALLLLVMASMIGVIPEFKPDYQVIDGQAQGTTYHIIFRPGGTTVDKRKVDSLLHDIDLSLSLWAPGSLINKFNASEKGIAADEHMRAVVHRAIGVNRDSHGTFDITIKPLMEIWGMGVAKSDRPLPGAGDIANALPCVGTAHLYWKGKQLLKNKPCTQIDVNGIAQGYSVDVLAGMLEANGVTDYLVELGGEIRLHGLSPRDTPWTIGVEGVDRHGVSEEENVDTTLQPGGGALTTAGNYRKFVESGGKRFSHIMDPRTGYPADRGVISVTVRAATAIDADAWDDAFMVLGVDSSFLLLRKHPELEAHFILATPDGHSKDTATSGFFKPRWQPAHLP